MTKIYPFFLVIIFFISCTETEKEEEIHKKYTIQQFMNSVAIKGSSFSPDEKKILASTERDLNTDLRLIDISSGKLGNQKTRS